MIYLIIGLGMALLFAGLVIMLVVGNEVFNEFAITTVGIIYIYVLLGFIIKGVFVVLGVD